MSQRANSAAVVREGESHVFTSSPFTGGNHSILHSSFRGDNGKQALIKVDGELISTVQSTPVAATLVWDTTQINLYYLSPSTSGGKGFLKEICKRYDDDWIKGSLTEKNLLVHENSGLAVWNDREVINVYFRGNDDGENEMTHAYYMPDDGEWTVEHVKL